MERFYKKFRMEIRCIHLKQDVFLIMIPSKLDFIWKKVVVIGVISYYNEFILYHDNQSNYGGTDMNPLIAFLATKNGRILKSCTWRSTHTVGDFCSNGYYPTNFIGLSWFGTFPGRYF